MFLSCLVYLLFLYFPTNWNAAADSSNKKREWALAEVPFPILNSTLTIDFVKVNESLKSINDKRVIWVIGKSNVGKTFIVDYVKQQQNDTKTSDALQKTIGLKVWYNDLHAIVDSQGMLRPIANNDVFFIRSFIISLMKRTADAVVLVTDQMDQHDLQFYSYLRLLYWSSKIDSMYHIHNCKTLNQGQLDIYTDGIVKSLNLNDETLTDPKVKRVKNNAALICSKS
jgi:hypothetical protein